MHQGIGRNPLVIVRYEDLNEHPEETLMNLMSKLGIKVDDNVIKDAIDLFDFEKNTKRKQGIEDKKSFRRKGIVGDWRNHFSSKDYAYFQEKAGDVL